MKLSCQIPREQVGQEAPFLPIQLSKEKFFAPKIPPDNVNKKELKNITNDAAKLSDFHGTKWTRAKIAELVALF